MGRRFLITDEPPKGPITVPGVLLSIWGRGVLVTGKSGVGKSQLALEMLSRGHALIADDAPCVTLSESGMLEGSGPAHLGDFLVVPGLGIMNARILFGENAVKSSEILWLALQLVAGKRKPAPDSGGLRPSYGTWEHLNVEIPELTLPVTPGLSTALLVETAVRGHELRLEGYDPVDDFIARQRHLVRAAG